MFMVQLLYQDHIISVRLSLPTTDYQVKPQKKIVQVS